MDSASVTTNPDDMALATFGAGCFWGTEKFFRKQFGTALVSSTVGYMGGNVDSPTYRQVCDGDTGHVEVLQIKYDATKVKYDELLDLFFRFHDPTTANRQGNDVGTQYRSVIFFHTPEQEKTAIEVKAKYQAKWPAPIVTAIEPATRFYTAEDYHQKYLDKNPTGYCNHRFHF